MSGGLPMLPTKPQTRAAASPLDTRVLLAGMPKAGKTTLLANWAPATTLIVDTHRGTSLLEGEHYVQHVSTWNEFEETVDLIVAGRHEFKTIGIDLIDDIYNFADQHAANKYGKVAAGVVEYGKGTSEAEGLFRKALGRLFASPYGLWFISHTDTEENQGATRYIPRLNKRVRTYVEGACQFILLAETLGNTRQLRTAPSGRFQAGARIPLPDPMPMDARMLYAHMHNGLIVAPPPDTKLQAAAEAKEKTPA